MSPRYSENILEELRSRCDIVELVQSYLPLKKAGRNFSACCPFHEETKPSFNVNPERQIFKCFGCGKGGNVFHFVMEREHVSFIEAVKMVADRVGYQLPVEKTAPSEGRFKKQDLFDAVSFAVRFYQQTLNSETGTKGAIYFGSRGLTAETIAELKLGYAPSGNSLHGAAREKGISDDVLEAAGLLVKDEQGALRDKFYNRVMFPIFSPDGRAIGFSGRVLDDGIPKYMNSPESPLFTKSHVLFGINFTREEITKAQHGIICEGHIDFATLYQNGVRNAVAAQGTAFTPEQARLLKRYTARVTFAFDSDRAGKKAVVRSLEPLILAGLEVRVAEIPEGHDPDSFVRARGAVEFSKIVEAGKDFFDFLYHFLITEHDITNRQGKLDVAGEMLAAIKKMPNEIVRDELLRKLSQNMHISVDALRVEMRKIRGSYKPFAGRAEAVDKRHSAEKELIHYALWLNNNFDEVVTTIRPDDFQRPECRVIAETLIALSKEKEKVTFDDVLNRIEDGEQSALISEMMMSGSPKEDPYTLGELMDAVLAPRRKKRKEELKRLMEEAMRRGIPIDPEWQEEYVSLHKDCMRRTGDRTAAAR